MEQSLWKHPDDQNIPFAIYKEFQASEKRKEFRWKVISLISAAGFVASLAMTFYALNLPKTVPLVITVSDWGEAKYVGNIAKYSYNGMKIPDIAIEYQLRKFVTNYYTIPGDSAVLKSNIKDCYAALTQSSASKLSSLLKENNPMEKFGRIRRTVSIESILSISGNSYQMDFLVHTESADSNVIKNERFRGILTVKLMEPAKEDQLLNPLGIYITNFDFTEVKNKEER